MTRGILVAVLVVGSWLALVGVVMDEMVRPSIQASVEKVLNSPVHHSTIWAGR